MSKTYLYCEVKQLGEGNALPLELAWRSSGGSLVAIFALAAVFLVVAAILGELIPENAFGEYTAPAKQALLVVLIFLAVRGLWRGLVGWKTESRAVIDGHTVTVTMKRLLKSQQWSEPLANYDGVRWRRYRIQTSRGDVSRTRREPRFRHVIELVHRDEARTVPLAVKTTGLRHIVDYLINRARSNGAGPQSSHHAAESELRPLWESLAALLELPAIDARDGAIEVRQAEDLDKSIRQLADEGRIDAGWSGDAPPMSLAVEQRGSPDDPASRELRVTVHAASLPRPVFYIFGGIGGFLLLHGIWNLDFPAIFGGLLFGGSAFGIWYLQRKNPNRIIITREEVRYQDPLVQRRSFVLPLSEIESINIRDRDSELTNARTLKLSGRYLLLSTDHTERAMGAGLDDNELEWLRGYLVAAIAKA